MVLIVGLLCSGKTEACKLLQAELDFLHVPCSSIMCDILGYSSMGKIDRRTLQDAGYRLVNSDGGHMKLAEALMSYMDANRSARYVLDGLRYPETSQIIEKHFDNSILIVYIESKLEDLVKRYGTKHGVEVAMQDFLLLLNHPVEQVRERYYHISDFVIPNYSSLDDYYEQIRLLFHGIQ